MARSSDGTSGNYLEATSTTALNGLQAGTVCAWVYITANVASSAAIIGRSGTANTNENFMLKVATAGWNTRTRRVSDPGNKDQIITTAGNPTGQWLHYMLTFDSASVSRIYINGVLVTAMLLNSQGTGDYIAGGGNLRMFNTAETTTYLNGRLAEVGIWNRVLDADEIALLAVTKYTPALITSGLLAAWRLLGNVDPEPDSVNSYNAAVVGSVPQADHVPGIVTVSGPYVVDEAEVFMAGAAKGDVLVAGVAAGEAFPDDR